MTNLNVYYKKLYHENRLINFLDITWGNRQDFNGTLNGAKTLHELGEYDKHVYYEFFYLYLLFF